MANTIQLYLLENRRVKVTKNGLPLAEDNSYRIIAGEEEATTFKIMSKPVDYELAEYTVEMVNSKGYGIMETAIVGDEFTLPISMATAGYGKIGIRAYLNDEVVTFEPIMVKVWNFIPTWKEQADVILPNLTVHNLYADWLLVNGKETQEKITEENKLPAYLVDGTITSDVVGFAYYSEECEKANGYKKGGTIDKILNDILLRLKNIEQSLEEIE